MTLMGTSLLTPVFEQKRQESNDQLIILTQAQDRGLTVLSFISYRRHIDQSNIWHLCGSYAYNEFKTKRL